MLKDFQKMLSPRAFANPTIYVLKWKVLIIFTDLWLSRSIYPQRKSVFEIPIYGHDIGTRWFLGNRIFFFLKLYFILFLNEGYSRVEKNLAAVYQFTFSSSFKNQTVKSDLIYDFHLDSFLLRYRNLQNPNEFPQFLAMQIHLLFLTKLTFSWPVANAPL